MSTEIEQLQAKDASVAIGVRYGLLVLAGVLGFSYVALLPAHPYPLSYLLKASPVILIAVIGLLTPAEQLSSKQKVALILAMLGAASGDIFLDFDRALYLKQALGSFLVTQLAYIYLFFPMRNWTATGRWLIGPLVLMVSYLIYQFQQTAGALFIPVLIYTILLSGMAFSALLVKHNRWINIGGVLFLFADALIGVNRFVWPFESSTMVIIFLYISAQLMIARGLLFKP